MEIYLEDVLNTISGQINKLKRVSLEINDARKIISGCNGCSNTPSTKGCPDCPVRGKLKEVELLNLVWDIELS